MSRSSRSTISSAGSVVRWMRPAPHRTPPIPGASASFHSDARRNSRSWSRACHRPPWETPRGGRGDPGHRWKIAGTSPKCQSHRREGIERTRRPSHIDRERQPEAGRSKGSYTVRVAGAGRDRRGRQRLLRYGESDGPGYVNEAPRLSMNVPPGRGEAGKPGDRRDCLSLPTPAEVIKVRAQVGLSSLRRWRRSALGQRSSAAGSTTPSSRRSGRWSHAAGTVRQREQRLHETHYCSERGYRCYLEKQCSKPSSYMYDADIAAAVRASRRARAPRCEPLGYRATPVLWGRGLRRVGTMGYGRSRPCSTTCRTWIA